jgi:hypothetical protein
MEMVWQKRPCKALGVGFWKDCEKPLEEILAIKVIPIDLCSLNTPSNHMM